MVKKFNAAQEATKEVSFDALPKGDYEVIMEHTVKETNGGKTVDSLKMQVISGQFEKRVVFNSHYRGDAKDADSNRKKYNFYAKEISGILTSIANSFEDDKEYQQKVNKSIEKIFACLESSDVEDKKTFVEKAYKLIDKLQDNTSNPLIIKVAFNQKENTYNGETKMINIFDSNRMANDDDLYESESPNNSSNDSDEDDWED